LHDELKEQVKFQISEVDKLFEEYNLFFQNVNYDAPSLVDVTVIGSIIHSFYNGIENIFERISKEIDNFEPTGNKTHQELLKNVYTANEKRVSVIEEETYMILLEYLRFRHVYRHSYSFQLNWEKLKPLSDNLFMTWNKVKQQIFEFLNLLPK